MACFDDTSLTTSEICGSEIFDVAGIESVFDASSCFKSFSGTAVEVKHKEITVTLAVK